MMETRARLQMELLFCMAGLLLIIIGSTTDQPCATSTCPLCQQCTANGESQFLGNQNQTAQVFCQGPGVVNWERLDDPIVPINTNTAKYRVMGNRLDILNVGGGDEAQYRCSYTEQGTGQLTTETSCVFVLGTAVFASCHSQSCPIELLPVWAGDEIVIDARIIFINSGPCMIPQNTTFLQLFKGDVSDENLRYECHDVEVCPPTMGSFQAVPAVPAVPVGGGSHKFNINLTKASAMMDDEGIYRVRVRVFNPRNGFAFMTKALSVSIYATPLVSTSTSTVISELPTMSSQPSPTKSSTTPTTSHPIPSPSVTATPFDNTISITVGIVSAIVILCCECSLIIIAVHLYYRKRRMYGVAH